MRKTTCPAAEGQRHFGVQRWWVAGCLLLCVAALSVLCVAALSVSGCQTTASRGSPVHDQAVGTEVRSAPLTERGSTGLLLALERLNVVGSALHTVAHPDDEDNGLLAYLSQGRHVRTVLLTATRGEGGQSLIGPEKAEAMGLVRTGEMLAACRYYGAALRFARTFDFGFSKTATETLGKWGRENLLGDFVRVIRQERPDIIVSRFGGTVKDGHGHHQAVGLITREAFEAAADPGRFAEQIAEGLRPWQAKRLFVGVGRVPDEQTISAEAVTIDYGRLDPVLGRSYHEIGVMGLHQNRSQGMSGHIAEKGSVKAEFVLWGSADSGDEVTDADVNTTDLFAGIDTTISGIAARVESDATSIPDLAERLESIEGHAHDALAAYQPRYPHEAVPALVRGIGELKALIDSAERSGMAAGDRVYLIDLLRAKHGDFVEAATRALHLDVELISERGTVTAGQRFDATVHVHRRGTMLVRVLDAAVNAPDGWTVAGGETEPALPSFEGHTSATFTLGVAGDAPVTEPYFKLGSAGANRYGVDGGADPTRPFGAPIVTATVTVNVMGVEFDVRAPLKTIDADRSTGVVYRDVQVVPGLSVKLDPPLVVQGRSDEVRRRAFHVNVTNHLDQAVTGEVTLEAPDGWRVEPASRGFDCAFESASAVVTFEVEIPADAAVGEAVVSATAHHEGKAYRTWHQVVSYPHTWRRHLYHPARCVVRTCDLQIAPDVRVGYILGRQDEVPAALDQLGVAYDLLDAKALESGDLSQYDTIVAGVRAYQFRADLKTHNQRVLDYVRRGGVFIVQYNKTYDWDPAQFTPYPTKMTERRRITDEAAAMTMLEPGHPIFQRPNRITAADFDGWVQERGLYFMTDWDERFVPLLSGHDPGEDALEGSMIVAEYGEGLYVYTALAWFRQLPAGVPGAYRMFANLISLPATRR